MYKVEKSKEDTCEPLKLRSRNFSMTSEEFLIDQKYTRQNKLRVTCMLRALV